MYTLATCEILIFQLISVAEETCLCLILSATQKTDFVAMGPIFFLAHLDKDIPDFTWEKKILSHICCLTLDVLYCLCIGFIG